MQSKDVAAVAFARPGGERCGGRSKRPIDLGHLTRQTMGDRDLEREVLSLFTRQAATAREQIQLAAPTDRSRLAHMLKGAASGVGAFRVADCAAAIEDNPHDRKGVSRLTVLIDEVQDFIAAISR